MRHSECKPSRALFRRGVSAAAIAAFALVLTSCGDGDTSGGVTEIAASASGELSVASSTAETASEAAPAAQPDGAECAAMTEFLLKAGRYEAIDSAPPTEENMVWWTLTSWEAVNVMRPLVDELRRTSPNAAIDDAVLRTDIFVEDFDHLMQDSATTEHVLTDGLDFFRQLANDIPPPLIMVEYMMENCGGPPMPPDATPACVSIDYVISGLDQYASSFEEPQHDGFGEWALMAHRALTELHPNLNDARRAAPNSDVAEAVHQLERSIFDFDSMLQDSTSLSDIQRNGVGVFGKFSSDSAPVKALQAYVDEECG